MSYERGTMKCFNCGNLWNFYLSGGAFVPKQGILCNVCEKQREDEHLKALYSASLKRPPITPPLTGSRYTLTGSRPRPSVTGSQPPITSSQPPASGSHPPVTGSHPPVTGSQPPITGSQGGNTGSLPGPGGPPTGRH